ncbi:LPS export ABC transporter permease LptG [Noviherbaspirillum cavernae]|uniref:LPS export ABC transporter permease LptG n=1 Tax=Noviherbaspirillum cavernae TaxID=2320862 RepID=A0A418X5W4_9BURK|nr:LPS export ABC transporter permease LptG [Noviherbaspirillum cavernae]RJG07868.1 LPS export ABC transporter permease LptG [Noviherbaspirillum cavernae]
MKVIEKYVAREILGAVLFVLLAFLALFAFFDLMGELQDIGRGDYRLQHAFLYIFMRLPGYTYDLIPIAALIGTIYALAQLAARSEFTIMRVSSMSTRMAGLMLAKVGLVFVVLTFVFGELIAPTTNAMAEKMRTELQNASRSAGFRSGLWTKDVIRQGGMTGEIVGSRFVNVRQVLASGQLKGVKLYEFDHDFRLTAVVTADHAEYRGENTWRLVNVAQTSFSVEALDSNTAVSSKSFESKDVTSEITPGIVSVLFADPDRMSARDLAAYTRYLDDNKQNSERYAISFWKKIVYPFAVFVMMALALPFAYLHFRAGGVSLKIFIGIMIGVSFQLINSLFSHIGLLNTWPALVTALLPSTVFLTAAIGALWWVERH